MAAALTMTSRKGAGAENHFAIAYCHVAPYL